MGYLYYWEKTANKPSEESEDKLVFDKIKITSKITSAINQLKNKAFYKTHLFRLLLFYNYLQTPVCI